MELEEYKIKSSTTCECGYEFVINDITELKRIEEDKFYGGVVRHYSNTVCPKCKKETLLLLKQKGQTYEIKDIAQKDIEVSETLETNCISNEGETDNEYICSICERSFKSKSGLSSHVKKHQNNDIN